MRITTTRTIHRSADEVWDVVGPRFAEAGVWASSIHASTGAGRATFEHAPCSARECHVAVAGAGRLVEGIAAYDDRARTLTYTLASGMERFVRSAVSTWSVDPATDHSAALRVDADFTLTGAGRVLRPVLRPYLSMLGRRNAADLAAYVETGRPSPRKQRQSARNPTLERAVALNALFSLASGIVLLMFSRWWAGEYGDVAAPVVALIGASLMSYAAVLGWLSRRGVEPRVGRLLSLLDGGWVVATAGLLAVAGARFSAIGIGAAVVTACVVAGFGVVQWRASRAPASPAARVTPRAPRVSSCRQPTSTP